MVLGCCRRDTRIGRLCSWSLLVMGCHTPDEHADKQKFGGILYLDSRVSRQSQHKIKRRRVMSESAVSRVREKVF